MIEIKPEVRFVANALPGKFFKKDGRKAIVFEEWKPLLSSLILGITSVYLTTHQEKKLHQACMKLLPGKRIIGVVHRLIRSLLVLLDLGEHVAHRSGLVHTYGGSTSIR